MGLPVLRAVDLRSQVRTRRRALPRFALRASPLGGPRRGFTWTVRRVSQLGSRPQAGREETRRAGRCCPGRPLLRGSPLRGRNERGARSPALGAVIGLPLKLKGCVASSGAVSLATWGARQRPQVNRIERLLRGPRALREARVTSMPESPSACSECMPRQPSANGEPSSGARLPEVDPRPVRLPPGQPWLGRALLRPLTEPSTSAPQPNGEPPRVRDRSPPATTRLPRQTLSGDGSIPALALPAPTPCQCAARNKSLGLVARRAHAAPVRAPSTPKRFT